MSTASQLTESNLLFKAFADATRLRILHLLSQRNLCVCHLMDALSLPQSTVSRHLAYLKRAGLVESWEEGTWNHYRLSEPTGRLHKMLLDCLTCCLGDISQLKQDRLRLGRG